MNAFDNTPSSETTPARTEQVDFRIPFESTSYGYVTIQASKQTSKDELWELANEKFNHGEFTEDCIAAKPEWLLDEIEFEKTADA